MRWNKERTAYLRTTYLSGMPVDEIARSLGVSVQAVTCKTHRMGLSRKRRTAWQAYEEEFLRDNFGKMTAPKISERLGRTTDAVYCRAKILGLKSRAK